MVDRLEGLLMPKIVCGAVECKFNNDRYECTAKRILLNNGNIMTMYEGRKDVWTCKQFELSDRAKQIIGFLKNIKEGD